MEKPPPPILGSLVAIRFGAFKGFEGTVESIDIDTARATVRIALWGREFSFDFPIRALAMDLAGFKAELVRQRAERHAKQYQKWVVKTLASLGNGDANCSVEQMSAIAGSYLKPDLGTCVWLLKLRADGSLTLQEWRDLGGSWGTLFDGFFLMHEGILRSNVKCPSSRTSFGQDGCLHVRKVESQRILAPRDSIMELDRLLSDSPSWLNRLNEAFFGLNLFFEQ